RAGVTGDGVVIVEGMDTIDVSKVTGSHSYIGDSQPVLNDLKALLRFERTLTEKAGVVVGWLDNHEYWILEELSAGKK
ncbi:MAG: hypothetical protein P1V36_11540, partial [Planctomycetota bacterium]|nr:hypothetical protein [Planctomycetota bacterium]